jgi:hypothetical protein
MNILTSPRSVYIIYLIATGMVIVFTAVYLSSLSSTAITQKNVISQIGWLVSAIITMIILGKIYEKNISNNITFIVGIYILYAFLSLLNLIYFYNIMVSGKSFNNSVMTNYRTIIGILNIVIFVLFAGSVYKDSVYLTISPPPNGLTIGNIIITTIYLICMLWSIYLLYVTSSCMLTYSITDG